MSHTNSPEYFTISTVNQYDGETTVLAICEDMDAVMWRLKQCYSSCGDEYRINCYHLTTAKDACEKYTEQQVSKAKYRMEEEEKEAKLKELEEIKLMSQDFDQFEAKENENWDALSDEEIYLQSQKEQEDFDKMMDYDPDKELAEELASHDVG